MASSAKTTWADVERGNRIEVGGKRFVVTKIKTKGKRAKVTVVGGGGEFSSEVKLKDSVTIVKGEPSKRERDAGGWHKPTKAERDEQARTLRPGLPPGDPDIVSRPRKPSGDPWERPRDKAERIIIETLGAHLVGETDDEAKGYYVPPVDESTVHAHLWIFHGKETDSMGEAEALSTHEAEHELVAAGSATLHVNHWHTKTRP